MILRKSVGSAGWQVGWDREKGRGGCPYPAGGSSHVCRMAFSTKARVTYATVHDTYVWWCGRTGPRGPSSRSQLTRPRIRGAAAASPSLSPLQARSGKPLCDPLQSPDVRPHYPLRALRNAMPNPISAIPAITNVPGSGALVVMYSTLRWQAGAAEIIR